MGPSVLRLLLRGLILIPLPAYKAGRAAAGPGRGRGSCTPRPEQAPLPRALHSRVLRLDPQCHPRRHPLHELLWSVTTFPSRLGPHACRGSSPRPGGLSKGQCLSVPRFPSWTHLATAAAVASLRRPSSYAVARGSPLLAAHVWTPRCTAHLLPSTCSHALQFKLFL